MGLVPAEVCNDMIGRRLRELRSFQIFARVYIGKGTRSVVMAE